MPSSTRARGGEQRLSDPTRMRSLYDKYDPTRHVQFYDVAERTGDEEGDDVQIEDKYRKIQHGRIILLVSLLVVAAICATYAITKASLASSNSSSPEAASLNAEGMMPSFMAQTAVSSSSSGGILVSLSSTSSAEDFNGGPDEIDDCLATCTACQSCYYQCMDSGPGELCCVACASSDSDEYACNTGGIPQLVGLMIDNGCDSYCSVSSGDPSAILELDVEVSSSTEKLVSGSNALKITNEEMMHFEKYTIMFNKEYSSDLESDYRRAIFLYNIGVAEELQDAQDDLKTLATFGWTKYSDWTPTEFEAILGLKMTDRDWQIASLLEVATPKLVESVAEFDSDDLGYNPYYYYNPFGPDFVWPTLSPTTEDMYCEDTNGDATDNYGWDCTVVYPLYPSWCGSFDDDDFIADDMCCACGGGYRPNALDTKTSAVEEVAEDPVVDYYNPTQPPTNFQEYCESTDGAASDKYGWSCTVYIHYPEWCGDFDDDDFTADEMCCACGGGVYPNEGVTTIEPPEEGTTTSTEVCEDTCGDITNLYDQDCWLYDAWAGWCELMDTDTFHADYMCCSCGGGTTGAATTTVPHPTNSPTASDCVDTDNGALDRWFDSCVDYTDNPHYCGTGSDDDFDAEEMCCVCGGGSTADDTRRMPEESRRRASATSDPEAEAKRMLRGFDAMYQDKFGPDAEPQGISAEEFGQAFLTEVTARFGITVADDDDDTCEDDPSHTDGGMYGWGCGFSYGYEYYFDVYEYFPSWCDLLNTETFDANELCCTCGGGRTSATLQLDADESCVDLIDTSVCEYLKTGGQCDSSYVQDNCQSTCGVCPTGSATTLLCGEDCDLTFDWSELGYTTEVKDQGSCGSSWSMVAAEVLESAMMLERTASAGVELSSQQLLSCDTESSGCEGGSTVGSWLYVQQSTDGLKTEMGYPYVSDVGFEGICAMTDVATKQSIVDSVPSKIYLAATACSSGDCSTQYQTEPVILQNLISYGTMAVGVHAKTAWASYTGGVMDQDSCGGVDASSADNMDHTAQLVGVNTDSSPAYWILRNSWGTDWGEEGYIYLSYGQNTCGIANYVTFVTL